MKIEKLIVLSFFIYSCVFFQIYTMQNLSLEKVTLFNHDYFELIFNPDKYQSTALYTALNEAVHSCINYYQKNIINYHQEKNFFTNNNYDINILPLWDSIKGIKIGVNDSHDEAIEKFFCYILESPDILQSIDEKNMFFSKKEFIHQFFIIKLLRFLSINGEFLLNKIKDINLNETELNKAFKEKYLCFNKYQHLFLIALIENCLYSYYKEKDDNFALKDYKTTPRNIDIREEFLLLPLEKTIITSLNLIKYLYYGRSEFFESNNESLEKYIENCANFYDSVSNNFDLKTVSLLNEDASILLDIVKKEKSTEEDIKKYQDIKSQEIKKKDIKISQEIKKKQEEAAQKQIEQKPPVEKRSKKIALTPRSILFGGIFIMFFAYFIGTKYKSYAKK